MDPKLLELHFSQLVKAWHKSKNNNFSDFAKQDYSDRLQLIFDQLKEENFKTKTKEEITLLHIIINFFFTSLEFLDNSTLSHIPYELIECLKFSLNEWIDDPEKYIIVTSLKNRINDFSFDQSLITNEYFYYALDKTYSISFPKRLIQINLPKYLARDYLANVVLFHELGHFIDLKYRISNSIKDDIEPKIIDRTQLTNELETNIKIYFPYLLEDTIDIKFRLEMFSYHIGEYFSDLFASQYIEKSSNFYLDYVTFSQNDYSGFHPSTTNRIFMVNSFLDKKNEFMVNIFKDATKKTTGRELKTRFTKLNHNDFLNLLPYEILEASQLSSLFIMGWDIWLNNIDQFKTVNKMEFDLKQSEGYQIINNLIEKSISNHVVKTTWAKTK